MSIDAFAAPGRFFKGNVHTHSSRSDGTLPPEEVCRRYKARGYDFLAITDHFLPHYGFPITDTRAANEADFVTILGAELHAPATSAGELWHILAVGLPLDFAPTAAGETGPELADRAIAAGAFVTIAHPDWYGLTLADAEALAAAHAIEVYNHTSEVHAARGGGQVLLDGVLGTGRRIWALATDDAHFNIEGDVDRDAFGGWIMVRAEANHPANLLQAMKAGLFYSSQGPAIEDMHREGNELVVRCSPASEIILLGRGSRAVLAAGDGLREARLPLAPFVGDWCRLVVSDASRRRAWSNPLWP